MNFLSKVKIPHHQIFKNLKTTISFSYLHTTYKCFSAKETIFYSNENLTQLYEYRDANKKIRVFFWLNMLYIYGNSLLLYFEIFDPAMGYFHGLMLTLSLCMGWGCFFLLGNVIQKTAFKIHKIENNPGGKNANKYKIEYLSFYKKGSQEIVDRLELVDFSQSNIENFYFVRNRQNKYKKIYVNPSKNVFEAETKLHREFKKFISAGNLE